MKLIHPKNIFQMINHSLLKRSNHQVQANKKRKNHKAKVLLKEVPKVHLPQLKKVGLEFSSNLLHLKRKKPNQNLQTLLEME